MQGCTTLHKLSMACKKPRATSVAAATDWIGTAAEQGVRGAARVLGDLYARGQGTPANVPDAARWYQTAVAEGDVTAKV